MKLAVYVNYRGNCEEAFRFYQEHLGATSDGVIRRHGEVPNPNIPPDWSDKVLHAGTPFANRFAMLRDRFGASWMLLYQP